MKTLAEKIKANDPNTIKEVSSAPIFSRLDNLIERPWGGGGLASFFGFEEKMDDHKSWGEAFVFSAHRDDPEASKNPGEVILPDQSRCSLLELLDRAGKDILGEKLYQSFGSNFSLLPKFLDVAELLSVQAHPAGYTEAYLILEADEGATIKLGFSEDIDRDKLAAECAEGRKWQHELLILIDPKHDQVLEAKVQDICAPFLAQRQHLDEKIVDALCALSDQDVDRYRLKTLLGLLQSRYGSVLDKLNTIPVKAGDIVYNVTPAYLRDENEIPTAAVHALGNTDNKRILALELRRPAPTHRVWDHVRFPIRPIDIEAALDCLNLKASKPEDYFVEIVPTAHENIFASIDDPSFDLEHIRLAKGQEIEMKGDGFAHLLIMLEGEAYLDVNNQTYMLKSGASALMPAGISHYFTHARSDQIELIKVNIKEQKKKEMTIRTPHKPDYLNYQPVELRFGTSGLRGLVRDMTDIEVYINTRGFLRYLYDSGDTSEGDPIGIAQDLRKIDPTTGQSSSPRIAAAVAKAIVDEGLEVINCGMIPTPALASWAIDNYFPSIMITGSHIPADRNGVKFYRAEGEVLKSDEAGILSAVKDVRAEVYRLSAERSPFNAEGQLKKAFTLPGINIEAERDFVSRYTSLFKRPFAGKKIVVYQHSAVGRDLLVEILEDLGADVIAAKRSDVFIPVDTEEVHQEELELYRKLVEDHGGSSEIFAVLSTDGDSDRPLIIDEKGEFHRGDEVGIIVSRYLDASFAAIPISSTNAIERLKFDYQLTKIGSPYVIDAMQKAQAAGKKIVCGWETNGGFMTQVDMPLGKGVLAALPTRDAFLPIFITMLAAIKEGKAISALFAELGAQPTGAGLIDNFSLDVSKKIIATLMPNDSCTDFEANDPAIKDSVDILSKFFNRKYGFGQITRINTLDGIRMFFDNGEVAHIRPSGNAPQLRIYVIAKDAKRVEEMIENCIRDGGIFRQMEQSLG